MSEIAELSLQDVVSRVLSQPNPKANELQEEIQRSKQLNAIAAKEVSSKDLDRTALGNFIRPEFLVKIHEQHKDDEEVLFEIFQVMQNAAKRIFLFFDILPQAFEGLETREGFMSAIYNLAGSWVEGAADLGERGFNEETSDGYKLRKFSSLGLNGRNFMDLELGELKLKVNFNRDSENFSAHRDEDMGEGFSENFHNMMAEDFKIPELKKRDLPMNARGQKIKDTSIGITLANPETNENISLQYSFGETENDRKGHGIEIHSGLDHEYENMTESKGINLEKLFAYLKK